MRCAICGKVISPLSEDSEVIIGGVCDASGMVCVHYACVESKYPGLISRQKGWGKSDDECRTVRQQSLWD